MTRHQKMKHRLWAACKTHLKIKADIYPATGIMTRRIQLWRARNVM